MSLGGYTLRFIYIGQKSHLYKCDAEGNRGDDDHVSLEDGHERVHTALGKDEVGRIYFLATERWC